MTKVVWKPEDAIARQRWLTSRAPRCPDCGRDVRLTASTMTPARWWCKKCKKEFEHEPRNT